LAEILGKPIPTPTAAPTFSPSPFPTIAPTIAPTATPTPPTGQYPDLDFGPFGNDENRTLAEFSRSEGDLVSFTIETDTEEDYDKVIVRSKSGWIFRSARVSGKTSRTFRNLRTPVTVRFYSDKDTPSDSVVIRDIEVK